MPVRRSRSRTVTIGNEVVRRLDSIHALLVDHTEIKFTPTEYRLITRLLEGDPVSDKELVTAIFNSRIEDDMWARAALDRHLDNVRLKLKRHRLKLYVHRISGFGYVLIPTSSQR